MTPFQPMKHKWTSAFSGMPSSFCDVGTTLPPSLLVPGGEAATSEPEGDEPVEESQHTEDPKREGRKRLVPGTSMTDSTGSALPALGSL